MKITKQIAFWFDNARPISLPQSLLPALLAISMAANYETFSWYMALMAFFGVLFAHLGMNLADDYFDYKEKGDICREEMAANGIRARIAKYPYLTSGKATLKQLQWAIAIFLTLASILGFVITLMRGPSILIIGVIAFILGLSYSGKPLQLGYRGFGELVIAIMFGPILMIGVQLASCGIFDMAILLVSIATGLLACNIVYTHSILDNQADAALQKMTFARLLKKPCAMLIGSYIFSFLPFILIVLGIVLHILHPVYAIVFIILPMPIYLTTSIKHFLQGNEIKINIKPWMGPMGNFSQYKEIGIDWFMLRWLLARNLITFFCLILIVVNIALILFT